MHFLVILVNYISWLLVPLQHNLQSNYSVQTVCKPDRWSLGLGQFKLNSPTYSACTVVGSSQPHFVVMPKDLEAIKDTIMDNFGREVLHY